MTKAPDPRIGLLASGKYYAFVNGYDQPEVVGTLEEVEAALGLRQAAKKAAPEKKVETWDVLMRFQFSAWDETDGILYSGIVAASKSEANSKARKMAKDDGHLAGGKGRVTFVATKI